MNLEQKVKETLDISDQDYIQIEYIIQENIKSDEVKDDNAQEIRNIKRVVVNKYSQNRKGPLFEAALVNGEPCFVTLDDSNQNIRLKLVSRIEEPSRVLIPPTIDEYLSEPYEFQSQAEIDLYVEKARKEDNLSLYKKARSIVSKYIDQESYMINHIAIYIVSSYFQDRNSTAHYTGIFGDNGTGKSSIGDTFEAVSYRPFNTTDPTPANIFRSLGNVEAGQITLILDESERIDQNLDMMSILKTGYDIRKTVSRVNQNTGKPEKFYTYCQKMIIGERPPGPIIGKGVNERILGDIVFYGNPPHDIKEVLNPTNTGSPELKELLSEITEFRKIMFVYRLLHFEDYIPDIRLQIKGRDKELVKPYLQLFSYNINTLEEKQIYEEIKNTFTKLLEIRNEKKHSTIEYALIPLILILMEESKKRKPIKFSELWDLLQYHIRGELNKNKPNEYNTEDYGTIYRNTLTNILQKLGVRTKRHNSYVELLFDYKKIKKTASQYGFTIQEKIGDRNSERSERSERSIDSLVKNIPIVEEKQANNNAKVATRDNENGLSDAKDDLKGTFVETSEDNRDDPPYMEPSQPSQPSPEEDEQDRTNTSLYRIGKTDTWGCEKCNLKGDKWFMQKHPCKGT